MKPLILYHRDTDGFVAALCYYIVLRDNAEYRSIQYGEPPPDDVKDRLVAIVDFSFTRDVTERLFTDTGGKLLVLDHHVTALTELQGLSYCQVDVNKSGALLTYQHLSPELKSMAERRLNDVDHPMVLHLEQIVQLVDDQDRSVNRLPDAKAASIAFFAYGFDFEFWRTVVLRRNLDVTIKEGRCMLAYEQRLVEMLLRNQYEGTLDEHKCRVVNSATLQSELGYRLADHNTIAVIWFRTAEGRYVYSLRSTDNGPDVSVIAKQYDGDGHPRAATFSADKLLKSF